MLAALIRLSMFSLLLFLSACADDGALDSVLSNYRYRMSNAFDIQVTSADERAESVQQEALSLYPSRRQLLVEPTKITISLLEFLRLSECELQRLVGERNSSLGLFQRDSLGYIYDRKFIVLAERCLYQRASQAGSTLNNQLESALDLKRKQLPERKWNMTFASEEFAVLFSSATVLPQRAELQVTPANLLEALRTLQYALVPDDVSGSTSDEANTTALDDELAESIESALAVIVSEKYMGKLAHAMWAFSNELDLITAAVETRLDAKPLCPFGRPTPSFKVVQNVFHKFYIGEVQPFAALVDQRSKGMLLSLRPLVRVYDLRPEAFELYWDAVWSNETLSTRARFLESISAHTSMWKRVLSECGHAPGQTELTK